MPSDLEPSPPPLRDDDPDVVRPGVTACSLCAGETLGGGSAVAEQMARLEDAARRSSARLTFSECLDRCERGDVVVVRPGRAGRRCGARPVWFERLSGDEATSDLARWLADGGPGRAPLPAALAPLVLEE